MSGVDENPPHGRRGELLSQANELVAGLLRTPWGQVSPSVYETGRLVSLAPGLTGHRARVDHLLRTQRPDGGWGAPDPGYALVPTLSATDALLATGANRAAAERGLRALSRWLRGPGAPTAARLPDLPAIELTVPAMIASINGRLESEPLPLPAGMSGEPLAAIRARLGAGGALPTKLLHALEVAGDAARGHPTIHPESTGTIGASPAATAAWLGDRTASPARAFLERSIRQHDGPVPCGLPITVFERSWVVSTLARAGIPVEPLPDLVKSLTTPLGPDGLAAADGLPVDADTTAGALYALALVGHPQPPGPLWSFETETHFATWPGEDGVSVSTNAHVLEAFGQYPWPDERYAATIAKVSAWLRGRQREDGSWHDRWHASPYYATACCALALHGFGGPESAGAVARAVRWVLDTQRADGSWGRWSGTSEETAYAVQILLLDRPPGRAVERGREYLERAGDPPPLWHDKDLYMPTAIVRAAIIAARWPGTTEPDK